MHGESDDDEDVGSQLDASEEEGSEEEAEEGEEEDESEEEESVDDAEDESEASEDEDEKASDEDSENDAQDSEFEQEGTEPSEKRVEKALTSLEAATSIDSPSPPASSSLAERAPDSFELGEAPLSSRLSPDSNTDIPSGSVALQDASIHPSLPPLLVAPSVRRVSEPRSARSPLLNRLPSASLVSEISEDLTVPAIATDAGLTARVTVILKELLRRYEDFRPLSAAPSAVVLELSRSPSPAVQVNTALESPPRSSSPIVRADPEPPREVMSKSPGLANPKRTTPRRSGSERLTSNAAKPVPTGSKSPAVKPRSVAASSSDAGIKRTAGAKSAVKPGSKPPRPAAAALPSAPKPAVVIPQASPTPTDEAVPVLEEEAKPAVAAPSTKSSGKSKPKSKPSKPGEKLISTVSEVPIRCAAVFRNTVWAAARTGTIVVRDMMTGEQVEIIETDQFMVWCMAVVGKRIWAGTEDGPILIYDGATRKLVKEARQHVGGVYCLATDKVAGAANRSVWSGSNDFTCNMWTGDGEFVKLYAGHTGGVRCVLVLGSQLWTGSDDHTIRVWDTQFGECLATLEGHSGSVLSMVACQTEPAGRSTPITCIWSASDDGSIRAWEVTGSRSCIRSVSVGTRVSDLAPMGDEIWSCGRHTDLTVWDTRTMAKKKQLSGHSSYVTSVLKVKRTESRWLWSFSLADKRLNIWQQNVATDNDASEVLASTRAAASAMAGDLDRLRDRISEQNDTLSRWERNSSNAQDAFASQLERVLSALAAEQEKSDKLASQVASLEAQLDSEHRKSAGLQHQVDEITASTTADKARLSALIDRLNSEIAELREANDTLSRQLAGAVSASDALSEKLRKEKAISEELRHQIKELKDLLAERDATVAKLQIDLSSRDHTIRTFSAEKAAVEAELAKLRAEFTTLQQRLFESGSDRSALDSKLAKALQEITALNRELERERSISARIPDLDRALSEARRQYDVIAGQLAEALAAVEASRRSEEAMRKKYLDLDVFKLDVIARELKGLEKEISRCKSAVAGVDVKSMTNFSDREKMSAALFPLVDVLNMCRTHMRDVINQCLTETQKLHIGIAIDDPEAGGDRIAGIEEGYKPPTAHQAVVRLAKQGVIV